MTILPATNKDLGTIKALLEKLYTELGEEKESLSFLDEELISSLIANNRTLIYKAIMDKKIVGMIVITESQAVYSGGYFGSIDEMYVEKEYRNQNVGERLIEKAVEIAKKKKWNRIDVTTPTDSNPATLNFYMKSNFMFTGHKLKRKIN